MKRYIKSGYYIGDYYLSDAELEEFQYYADHPELLKDIPEDTEIDRSKYPETYDFTQHKEEINSATAELNAKYGDNWKWRVGIFKNTLKLYWGYFKYLNLAKPYVTITYNYPEDKYSVWFKVIDPNDNNLTYELEFNDNDIKALFLNIGYYITSRW